MESKLNPASSNTTMKKLGERLRRGIAQAKKRVSSHNQRARQRERVHAAKINVLQISDQITLQKTKVTKLKIKLTTRKGELTDAERKVDFYANKPNSIRKRRAGKKQAIQLKKFFDVSQQHYDAKGRLAKLNEDLELATERHSIEADKLRIQ